MEDTSGQQFVLNPATLLAIGGIMGVLTGAIGKLFQSLMETKSEQITDLKTQVAAMTEDRDFWRDQAAIMAKPAERALDIADDVLEQQQQRPRRPRSQAR